MLVKQHVGESEMLQNEGQTHAGKAEMVEVQQIAAQMHMPRVVFFPARRCFSRPGERQVRKGAQETLIQTAS